MQEQQPMEEERKEPINFGRFSIFLLAKSAQHAYGVRTGDYARYRRYCTRKISKLRQSMHYKYGNKTKFNKKDIVSDKSQDQRVLQVVLYSCQKYWAYANQCKFAQTIKQEHKLRARFQAIKKFRRAFQWTNKLVKLSKQSCDSITASEAQAYQFFMEGLYLFEKQQWKGAQSKLIGCRQIIKDLVGSVDSMSGKIYKQKIDQIDQTIKFCNFKISKGQQMPIEQIVEMLKVGDPSLNNLIENITERRMNELSVNAANELRFGEEHYTMKNEKIIIQKNKIDEGLVNLQVIKKKALLELGDEQLYEELLNFFSNVIILVDQAIKMVDADKEDTKNSTQGEIEILKKVSLLFQQIKLKIFIDRNFTIFKHSYQSEKGRKSAPQTLCKLLSNTITVYTQLIEIEKQINEGTELAPEKIRQIDACIFFVRTIRLNLVGQVYYNNGKIKEAYSLWNECERCLQTVKNSKQAMSLDFVDFQKIRQQTKISKMRCVIENYKASEGNSQKMTQQMKQMKIDEQIEKDHQFTLYDLIRGKVSQKQSNLSLADHGNLDPIDLPGKIQPIPTRPIFYDIFFTELGYPSLEDKMQKNQQKGGWWGKLFGK